MQRHWNVIPTKTYKTVDSAKKAADKFCEKLAKDCFARYVIVSLENGRHGVLFINTGVNAIHFAHAGFMAA